MKPMRSLLVFCFHPAIFPPTSGGELRLYNIYRNLSRHYQVTLVTFMSPNSENAVLEIEHSKNFTELRVPKTWISGALHRLVNSTSDISECSSVITSIESRFNGNFRKIVEKHMPACDALIFVSPFLFTIPSRLLAGKKIIYESYNVEYELMKPIFSASAVGRLMLRYVRRIEGSLIRRCDLAFAVSGEDRIAFSGMYGMDPDRIRLSPNGINSSDYILNSRSQDKRPACLFIGSYHPPNIEAISRIREIAPVTPEITYLLAGGASRYYVEHDASRIEHLYTDPINPLRTQPISPLDGFHERELWDNIPTIWTRPEFSVRVSPDVSAITLKLYSKHGQKIECDIRGNKTELLLMAGWNTVHLDMPGARGFIDLRLTVQKALMAENRELGVAIQEVWYEDSGRREKLDFVYGFRPVYRFIDVPNVILLGYVSDSVKHELYRTCSIALNPMMSGSGTNIKMLDYMAAGLPVITTQVGARGLDLDDNRHAIICDIGEFPEKMRELLVNDGLYERLSTEGRKLVEERYEWKNISDKMAADLEKALNE